MMRANQAVITNVENQSTNLKKYDLIETETNELTIGSYHILVPALFFDCITDDIMGLPVTASDDNTYDAPGIVNWIAKSCKENKVPTSPLTNLPFDHLTLAFNETRYLEIKNFFKNVLEYDLELQKEINQDAFDQIKKYATDVYSEKELRQLKRAVIESCKDASVANHIILKNFSTHIPAFDSIRIDIPAASIDQPVSPSPANETDSNSSLDAESNYRLRGCYAAIFLGVNLASFCNLGKSYIPPSIEITLGKSIGLDVVSGIVAATLASMNFPQYWTRSRALTFADFVLFSTTAAFSSAAMSALGYYMPVYSPFIIGNGLGLAITILSNANGCDLSRNICSFWNRPRPPSTMPQEETERLIPRPD